MIEGHQLGLFGGDPEPIAATPQPGGGDLACEIAMFGLFARLAAGRLTEITGPERDTIAWLAAETRFPFLAYAARDAIARLPDAPTQNPAVLWERGAPADASAEDHTPVAHVDKTEVEKKTLARLTRNPGKLGTMRDRVLRELMRHAGNYPELAMTKIELAEEMGTTRDHVHPRIEELVKGGWVTRCAVVDEKRSGVLFYASPKAYAWYRDEEQAR